MRRKGVGVFRVRLKDGGGGLPCEIEEVGWFLPCDREERETGFVR